ncbi:hypothetical protein J6R97_01110 [bacterium]|nr:hypothetical protein [bacterium]
MVVKPIMNIVTKKNTKNIVDCVMRECKKPTSFDCLRLPPPTCDVFKASGVRDYLSADFIKSLLNIKGKTQIETATMIKDEILTAMKYENPGVLKIVENPFLRGSGSFNSVTGKISFSQIPESKEDLIALLYHELDHMDKFVKLYKAKGAEAFEELLNSNLRGRDLKSFKLNKDFYETMAKDISLEGFNVNKYQRAVSKYRNFDLDELYDQFLYFQNYLEKDAYALQKKVLTTLGKDGFVVADTFPKSYIMAARALIRNPGKINLESNNIEDCLEGLYKLARLKCVEQTLEVKKAQSLISRVLRNGYNNGNGGLSNTEKEWLFGTYKKIIGDKELKEMGQKPSELVQSWLEQAFK